MFGIFYILTLTLSQGASIFIDSAISKNFMYSAISKWLLAASIAELGIRHAKEPSTVV